MILIRIIHCLVLILLCQSQSAVIWVKNIVHFGNHSPSIVVLFGKFDQYQNAYFVGYKDDDGSSDGFSAFPSNCLFEQSNSCGGGMFTNYFNLTFSTNNWNPMLIHSSLKILCSNDRSEIANRGYSFSSVILNNLPI